MGNSSIITDDARQWIIDETARLGADIALFGSNVSSFSVNFQAQIDAFTAYENAARTAFVDSFNSQIATFYENGTTAIAAHTGKDAMEVHGTSLLTSTYLDNVKDIISVKVLEITTTGGTVYAPCSASSTGPQ